MVVGVPRPLLQPRHDRIGKGVEEGADVEFHREPLRRGFQEVERAGQMRIAHAVAHGQHAGDRMDETPEIIVCARGVERRGIAASS
jgi:hypothetical protein